ncbi:MAG: carboxymuconolactone decarboxylase family protein [Gammaproteobacteria bacterium]|nr:carboxymuconolactone decarboxylase family protein [Gammaproteobacteria bacterium]
MNLSNIKQRIPEYARDLRLNIGSVLTPEGAPGLSEEQIRGVALASAIASGNAGFARELESVLAEGADAATMNGAKAAAAIMGMNNVYYRFLHLVGDDEYATMPARLRMNVMARPGIEQADFELYSLAVSAVNGCGKCIESHEKTLRRHGVGREAVQSAARIAAVIHAVAATLAYEGETAAAAAAA